MDNFYLRSAVGVDLILEISFQNKIKPHSGKMMMKGSSQTCRTNNLIEKGGAQAHRRTRLCNMQTGKKCHGTLSGSAGGMEVELRPGTLCLERSPLQLALDGGTQGSICLRTKEIATACPGVALCRSHSPRESSGQEMDLRDIFETGPKCRESQEVKMVPEILNHKSHPFGKHRRGASSLSSAWGKPGSGGFSVLFHS